MLKQIGIVINVFYKLRMHTTLMSTNENKYLKSMLHLTAYIINELIYIKAQTRKA